MSQPPAGFSFQQAARNAMLREGFKPDFPAPVLAQVKSLPDSPPPRRAAICATCSGRALTTPTRATWIRWNGPNGSPMATSACCVGIADVDSVVRTGSPADLHARDNATSVYTGGPVYSMLPERLSTDLTSLRPDQDRAALIMEYVVDSDGDVTLRRTFARRSCATTRS